MSIKIKPFLYYFQSYISHPLANLLHGAGAGYMQVGVHVHANYVIHMYDTIDRKIDHSGLFIAR